MTDLFEYEFDSSQCANAPSIASSGAFLMSEVSGYACCGWAQTLEARTKDGKVYVLTSHIADRFISEWREWLKNNTEHRSRVELRRIAQRDVGCLSALS